MDETTMEITTKRLLSPNSAILHSMRKIFKIGLVTLTAIEKDQKHFTAQTTHARHCLRVVNEELFAFFISKTDLL